MKNQSGSLRHVDGLTEGEMVGVNDKLGNPEGWFVGCVDGTSLILIDGTFVGWYVGPMDERFVGDKLGTMVG